MENGKYIVLDMYVCDHCPIVFPPYIGHDDIVRKMGFKKEDVISAGFVEFGNEKNSIRCYGRSTTLGKEARPEEDAKLIRRLFHDPFYD
jgi:hypothetical protein